MAGGTKTKTASKVAAVSFGTMFIDPSGASVVVFATSGSAAIAGGLFHGTKKAWKTGKKLVHDLQDDMNDNRERHTQVSLPGMSPSEHIQFQLSVEQTFRRLASAVGGVTVNGVLFCQFPTHGLAFAFNAKELVDQSAELRRLAQDAGGLRKLLESVSLENIAIQSLTGGAIKTLTTFVFIGNDFVDFVDGISQMADHFESHPIQQAVELQHPFAGQVKHAYEIITSYHPLAETTAIAATPVDIMKELVSGETEQWTWEDHKPVEDIIAVAATVLAVDQAQNILVDERLHKEADKAIGTAS